MSPGTLLRHQFGDRAAIREVAQNRASLLVGLCLVLITAIPRNYDQSFVLESRLWLFRPLLFSLFSGTLIFSILRSFLKSSFPKGQPFPAYWNQWFSFMGLFWMTAPVAWLYALPVERFLDFHGATRANLILLAAVSLWRVLLLARVLAVLQPVSYWQALGWVLVAASVEVLLVSIFGIATTRGLMVGMMGMRNAPEEDFLVSIATFVMFASIPVWLLTNLALVLHPLRKHTLPFPAQKWAGAPWRTLLMVALAWCVVAIPAQLEQHRFATHARLIEEKRYQEAAEFLARYERDDFPPLRRLEPNPYEYRVFEQLPKTIQALRPEHPAWVWQYYRSHLEVYLVHWPDPPFKDFLAMLLTVKGLPEGQAWLESNQERLREVGEHSRLSPTNAAARLNVVFQELGLDSKE